MKNFLSYFTLLSIFLSCQKLDINRITKIVTNSPTVNGTNVVLNGTIIDISSNGIQDFGHCLKLGTTPYIDDVVYGNINNPEKGGFYSSPKGLQFQKNYKVRSYAVSNNEVFYGEEEFIYLNSTVDINLSSNETYYPDQYNLNISSEITGVGSLLIQEYGHCWNYTGSPNISDTKSTFTNLTSDSIFTSPILNLIQGQMLSVRSYMKVSNGLEGTPEENIVVKYGPEYSKLITTPTLTTNNYFISGNNAVLVGDITETGVLNIVQHGHCWSTTNSSPDLNANVTTLGTASSVGTYNSSIQVSPGFTYYYRAYLTDASGTTYYGNTNSFSF